jgi:aryl-alcohol dehydrogenase-like predicted oxidoreductase
MSNTKLPTVELGKGGPLVGVQGLGCMGMSEFYGATDTTEAKATLDAALEAGVTLFDTADMYGAGANEELVGPFIKANRDRTVIATKFGIERVPGEPTRRIIHNEPEYIRKAVDASLKRLGIDVIDLYYMHRRNHEVPLEDSIGAMAELVKAGKVRHLGLSEVTADELREAHAIHPIAAVQSEWSLFTRVVERAVVPAAAELGVALVPYAPLGRGFLTGAFASAGELAAGDFRHSQPRFTGENAAANAALLAPVHQIAADREVTSAQVALAWLQQRAQVHNLTVVPIPGTRKRTRLAENVAGAVLELTEAELAMLEPIAGQVTGDRYADMNFVSDNRG